MRDVKIGTTYNDAWHTTDMLVDKHIELPDGWGQRQSDNAAYVFFAQLQDIIVNEPAGIQHLVSEENVWETLTTYIVYYNGVSPCLNVRFGIGGFSGLHACRVSITLGENALGTFQAGSSYSWPNWYLDIPSMDAGEYDLKVYGWKEDGVTTRVKRLAAVFLPCRLEA